MSLQAMSVEDATNILYGARSEEPEDRVAVAGLRLVREVERLEQEFERANARARARAERIGRSDVAGHRLILGEDAGGARHFLDSGPVSAGSGLYLLTEVGWLGGRYESARDADGELRGYFYFGLPGCGWREYVIPIEDCTRLAWPREVEGW